MECFDTEHVRNVEPLREMGFIFDKAVCSLVMGVLGGIPATLKNLIYQIKQLPKNTYWQLARNMFYGREVLGLD